MTCPLCSTVANHFYSHNHREFYFCSECFAVFLDSKNIISKSEEKKYYQKRTNLRDSFFYQGVIEAITSDFKEKNSGLDFGSGENSLIVDILKQKKYKIEAYDPFFSDDKEKLKKQYDYITCHEVIEHFHYPDKEFKALFKLLKPKGKLYCITNLFSEKQNFDTWDFKNDPTNVFFYHEKSIEWIKNKMGFKNVIIKGNLIVFEK